MDLCVHFEKPACIVFISSLYLYFGFQINIFQFNSGLLVACCALLLIGTVMTTGMH